MTSLFAPLRARREHPKGSNETHSRAQIFPPRQEPSRARVAFHLSHSSRDAIRPKRDPHDPKKGFASPENDEEETAHPNAKRPLANE
tara:strand:- start:9 stop:269 length:261 start_codon:yes stop_codon:yes gene_type:complete